MQPGDELEAKGPYGGFIFRQPAETICVATGTGIAPFRGMLQDRLAKDPLHRYTLIFGARHEHGLLYLRELSQDWHEIFKLRGLSRRSRGRMDAWTRAHRTCAGALFGGDRRAARSDRLYLRA